MNIYSYEIKANLKSTISFIIGIIVFAAIYMSFFSSFAGDTNAFMDILKGYPPELEKALGVGFSNITSLLGYYSFVMVFITLIGGVQAMNLGLSILSKEERDKTAEFLLVKPVSRFKIMFSKISAAYTLILMTNIVYFLVSYGLLKLVEISSFDTTTFLLINVSLIIVQLIFVAIGFFIGVFIKRIRTIIPISLAVVFGFFAIGAFAVNAADDKLRYLSPFKYYDYNYILENKALETSYLVFALILIIILIIASFIIYKKRDIESV